MDIEICVDCASLHANADTTGIDDPDREAEVLAGLERHPRLCVGDFATNFSTTRCEACRSPLAGARYEAVII
jgi:hypothetical protein